MVTQFPSSFSSYSSDLGNCVEVQAPDLCHGTQMPPLPLPADAAQTGPVFPSWVSLCSSMVSFPPEVTRFEVRPREPAEQLPD